MPTKDQENKRQHWRDWYHRNKDKAREARKNTQERTKQWYIDYKKSQKCKECGFDDYRALQFHHRDPETKVGDVATIAQRGTRKKLKAELEKCDCLCANCHQIHEYESRKI